MSDKKNDEKNEEKIAPLVAGAARVGVSAAKNPAVRGAVGGAVQGMMKKWIDEPFEIAWELMKSESQGCDVCGETDGVFTYMDENKRAHMVCSDACMDKGKGKGRGTTPVLGGGRMVKSDEKGDNAPTNPGLWSQAKSKARSKFKVYPSAYANGWASKWYKSKGGGWKKKSKGGKKK